MSHNLHNLLKSAIFLYQEALALKERSEKELGYTLPEIIAHIEYCIENIEDLQNLIKTVDLKVDLIDEDSLWISSGLKN